MSPLDEHQIESLLKKLQAMRADEAALVRAKNVVMASVRKDFSDRQERVERSESTTKIPFILIFKRKYMPVIAIILAVMLGGGGTVAAAQNDLPGDTLYGVKLASEAVASVAIPFKQAKLKFAAKRAERRGVEIAALAQKVKSSAPEKQAELNRYMEKAAERLEYQASELEVQIAEFGQAAEPTDSGTITTTTEVHTKLEAVKDVLAEIAASTEVSAELKAKAAQAQVVLEALRAKAIATEDTVIRRHASEVGFEHAAQGRVQAASNKLDAVTSLRARILKDIAAEQDTQRLTLMKKEFEQRDEFYREAVSALEEARAALSKQAWPDALAEANKAFKFLIQFMSPLSRELRHEIKIKLFRPETEPTESEPLPAVLPEASVSEDSPQLDEDEAAVGVGGGGRTETSPELIAAPKKIFPPKLSPEQLLLYKEEQNLEWSKTLRIRLDKTWESLKRARVQKLALPGHGYVVDASYETQLEQQLELGTSRLRAAEQAMAKNDLQQVNVGIIEAERVIDQASFGMQKWLKYQEAGGAQKSTSATPPAVFSPTPTPLDVTAEVSQAEAESAAKTAHAIVEQYKTQLNEAVKEKAQYLAAKADANLTAGKYLEARNLYLQIITTVKASVSIR